MSATVPEPTHSQVIETHTIDFIPLAERHGKPWNLFTLWFGANTLIISVITGAFVVGSGMGLDWSALAVVIGFGLGTVLVAGHAAQGPSLGIPQMIQSRAQFGYVGGIVPMVVAEVAYIGFFAANPAVAGLVANAVWGVNVYLVVVLVTLITFVVALFGYDMAHRLGKYLSVAGVVVFGIFTVLVIAHYGIPHPNTADLHGGFNEGLFLGSIALCFIYAAGYAPYVADYSRYLPANSSAKATGWWTYFGLAISSIWLFLVGAYLTMVTGFNFNTLGSVFAVTDHFSRAFTYIAAVVMICTMVLQGSLSMYAGGNTTVSIVTSLQRRPRPVKPNLSMRLASLTPISILCLIAAILYAKSFATAFTDMLGVLLILLIPWSTINLVDYYFVRRGHYNIADIFNPHGRYGTFNPAGLVSFFLAFGLEWLFVNLSFYQSPVAHALHDGDISWVVGMLVSGGCYLWMTKSVREAARAHEKGRVPEDMAAEVAES